MDKMIQRTIVKLLNHNVLSHIVLGLYYIVYTCVELAIT